MQKGKLFRRKRATVSKIKIRPGFSTPSDQEENEGKNAIHWGKGRGEEGRYASGFICFRRPEGRGLGRAYLEKGRSAK